MWRRRITQRALAATTLRKLFSIIIKLGNPYLTSVPASRDAPRNETNHRYFGFKGL